MSRSSLILVVLVILVGVIALLLSRMDTSVQPTRIEKSVQANAEAR